MTTAIGNSGQSRISQSGTRLNFRYPRLPHVEHLRDFGLSVTGEPQGIDLRLLAGQAESRMHTLHVLHDGLSGFCRGEEIEFTASDLIASRPATPNRH